MTGWSPLYGRITETVSVTEGGDGFNVAPMGVVRRGGDDGDDCGDGGCEVFARLWRGSDTLENVRETGRVVVNFTRDPVVYVESALDDADGRVVDGRLEGADAWIRCSAEREGTERDGEVERWRLNAVETEVETRRVYAVNRGFNAVVEAAVDATRLGFRPELRERVERNAEVALKCGGPREERAVEVLKQHVDLEG